MEDSTLDSEYYSIVRKVKQRLNVIEIGFSNKLLHLLVLDKYQHSLCLVLETFVKPSNPFYVKQFLQKLIARIEGDIKDCDYDIELYYNYYMELISTVALPPSNSELIYYPLDLKNSCDIKIEETPRLLNGLGSTGYRTWEACLYLAEYLAESGEFKNTDTVLELGAGTGLLSLTVLKNYNTEKIYVSDGDSKVFEQTKKNFALNGADMSKIEFLELQWGQESQDIVPSNLNWVIAADVTYDTVFLNDLGITLNQALQQNGTALVAASVRKESTVQLFEEELVGQRLQYEVVNKELHPATAGRLISFPKTQPEIRIYKIHR